MKNEINLSNNILRLRHERKLTQEALAEQADIHNVHLSRIENGTSVASLDTVFAIANALGVTSDTLLLDVLDNSLQIAATELSEQIKRLSPKEQQKILKAVSILAGEDD